MSRGAREAKNELKEGLFGHSSDKLVPMATPLNLVTVFCLGVMSTSEMRDSKSEKMFP